MFQVWGVDMLLEVEEPENKLVTQSQVSVVEFCQLCLCQIHWIGLDTVLESGYFVGYLDYQPKKSDKVKRDWW